MSKISTHWINFSSIMRRWARDGEDAISVSKIHPLESAVLLGSFAAISGLCVLIAANRLDLVIIWAGDVYEALPKVFK